MKKKSGNQKIEKEINKELEKARSNKKEMPVNALGEKEKKYRIMKVRYIIESVIVLIFCIFMLLLLCNRTFFKDRYKTSKIDIEIPLMMYFVKDDGNELMFKTLRKSSYLDEYFESKLINLPRYTCGSNVFYYDSEKELAIYDIDIDKTFAIKTVTIRYATGNYDCLCNMETDLKSAEEMCNR